MTDKMTLSDLERIIRVSEPYSCEGAGDDFEKGFHHCRQWAGGLVKKNRTALEAGMRRELGQRKCESSFCDNTIFDQLHCDACRRLLES